MDEAIAKLLPTVPPEQLASFQHGAAEMREVVLTPRSHATARMAILMRCKITDPVAYEYLEKLLREASEP